MIGARRPTKTTSHIGGPPSEPKRSASMPPEITWMSPITPLSRKKALARLPIVTTRSNSVTDLEELRLDSWIRSPEFFEESVFAEDPAPLNLRWTADAEIDRTPTSCPGKQGRDHSVQEEVKPAHRMRAGSKRYAEKCEQSGRDIPENAGKQRPGNDHFDLVDRRDREVGYYAHATTPPRKS